MDFLPQILFSSGRSTLLRTEEVDFLFRSPDNLFDTFLKNMKAMPGLACILEWEFKGLVLTCFSPKYCALPYLTLNICSNLVNKS